MSVQKVFFFLFALIFIVSTYLIIDDSILFGEQRRSDSVKAIGTIKSLDNDVRTKDSDGFSWMPAKVSGTLYQADRIFTGDGSTVVIELNNASLHLGENSLVTLGVDGNSLMLDLTMGSFAGKIAANKNIVLISNGKKKKIVSKKKSKIKVTLDDKGKDTFAVLDGEVELKVAAKKAVLKKDMQASFTTKLSDFKVAARAIELIFPVEDAKEWKVPGQNLDFRWEKVGGKQPYKLELSRSDNFKRIVKSINTQSESVSMGGVTSGRYYWRVSRGENVSTARLLTYLEQRAPIPMLPSNSEIYLIEESLPLVTFKWRDPNDLKNYRIEVSSDSSFKEKVYDEAITGPRLLLDKLDRGTYFWRVQSIAEKSKPSDWSQIRSFSIYNGAKPRFLDPESGYEAELEDYRAKVKFRWEKEGRGLKYRFEIMNKEKVIHSTLVDSNETSFLFTEIGDFSWIVSKILPNGNQVSQSNPMVIKVSMALLNSPSLEDSSINHTMKKYRVDPTESIDSVQDALALEWKKVKGAVQYEIVIFDQSGAKIKVDRTSQPLYLWSDFRLGSYLWQVRAIDRFNRLGQQGDSGKIKVMEEKECKNKFLFFCY